VVGVGGGVATMGGHREWALWVGVMGGGGDG